jgi:imidazolonepropionase-like amidohydrolase
MALVGVTVIDGLGNPPRPGQVVVLRDGRIAEVAAAEGWQAPRGVKVIDLSGRYLMPGLIDTHAHVTILPLDDDGTVADAMSLEDSERALRTLVAFGVTTVRNPAAPTADGVALRERVASGEVLGPRIVTAGAALSLTRAGFGPFVATPDKTSVRQEIRRQAAAGVDVVKVYAALPPELVRAAIEEAHALGKPVVGHLQRTTWTAAARLGIDAVTHAAPWSVEYLPAERRSGYQGTMRDRLRWLEEVDFDGPEIQEMIAVLAERGVTVDPTLIALHTKFFGDDPQHLRDPELHLAPAASRAAWQHITLEKGHTGEILSSSSAANRPSSKKGAGHRFEGLRDREAWSGKVGKPCSSFWRIAAEKRELIDELTRRFDGEGLGETVP